MLFWEWERLESYVEHGFFQISDAGKLLSPVKGVKIWRDESLNLVMEARSSERPNLRDSEYPPGTLRRSEDEVKLDSPGGGTACAFGVNVINTKMSNNYQHGTHETVQTCSFHYFESTTPRSGAVSYVFDWIANIDQGYYFWPDGVADSVQEISTRTLGSGLAPVVFTANSSSDSASRNCVELNIDGFRVILGASRLDTGFMAVKPGYIIYVGHPDEDTRKRIRDSLSFALGFPIVYLGYEHYNERQELLYLRAFNAYSMDGRAFKVPVMAPAPICSPASSNMLDKNRLGEVVNSFYYNYYNFNLKSLNWVYWHAVTAPAHMAAAYFGAIVESIQKSYIDQAGSSFNNLIIPKQEYRALRKAVLEVIKDCNLSPQDKKIFEDKINGGNVISLKVRSRRFFEYLGLEMGDAELNAWQRRNDAAHGNELVDGDYISLIRETKLLKLILHRIVLKITGASVEYIDYYTLNFPIREVKDGVSE